MPDQDLTELQGASPHPVDSTGRITLKKHEGEAIRTAAGFSEDEVKAKLPVTVVVTQDPDRCLLLFTPAGWESFSAPILDLSPMDPDASDLRRMYVGPAETVTIDKQDRLKLSTTLRNWAGLPGGESHAMLVDTGVRHELWEVNTYREYLAGRSADLKDVSRRLWGTPAATEEAVS